MRSFYHPPRDIRKFPLWVEYDCVVRHAACNGWLSKLIWMHAKGVTQDEARSLVQRLAGVPVKFGSRSGRAYSKPYRVSLPRIPGGRLGQLRLGIVVHEAAHIIDHRKTGKFGHRLKFCQEFQRLTESIEMTTPLNFRPIYDRHQGPYSILMTREDDKGRLFTDRITGSAMRAQATHEKAIELISGRDPKFTNVDAVFVFSDTEGQFTGALYKRGEAYAAWEHIPVLDDAPPVAKVKPRLTVKEAAAKTYPAANAIVQADTAAAAGLVGHTMVDGDVPTPKKERPAKLPGDRFPAMRGRPLVAVPEGNWPKSAPAQFVRSFFGQQPPDYSATSAELVAAIGQSLTDLGVQFPASLISRLKQAGLLKEKSYESQESESDAPEQEAAGQS